jgi:hypothetical protein
LSAQFSFGKRAGYGKDNMAPHSMTLTMVGASILFVGWFGFNAGSNLEANGGAALAMINTFTATAGAIIAWVGVEALAAARPRCWAPRPASSPVSSPSRRPRVSSARSARSCSAQSPRWSATTSSRSSSCARL